MECPGLSTGVPLFAGNPGRCFAGFLEGEETGDFPYCADCDGGGIGDCPISVIQVLNIGPVKKPKTQRAAAASKKGAAAANFVIRVR